ncbi:MAG: SdrD B-like domain-containing protein [Acidobacteriota bacterium]
MPRLNLSAVRRASLAVSLPLVLLAAFVPGAALAQSDTLVEFFGHVPFTWDEEDPQADNRIPLRGRLVEPAGPGPHPAVVVLHGSKGMWHAEPSQQLPDGDMKSQFDDWASMLTADGYIALILDSFGPRGYTTFQGKVPPEDADVAPVYERSRDAFDALAYLRTLPQVDGERVAVLGFSHGGGGVAGALADADAIEAEMGTSFSVSTTEGQFPGVYDVPRPARPAPGQTGFDCGVAYYPGALFFSYFGGTQPTDGYFRPYAPLLMIYGGLDELWTSDHPLVLEDKALLAGSGDLTLSAYGGVGHSFDTSGTVEASDARIEARSALASCLAGAEVTGRVWADLDADGLEGGGEPPLEGVLLEITDGGQTWQTTSDWAGNYRFQGLPANVYDLSVAAPADYAVITAGSSVFDAQGEALALVLAQGQTVDLQHAPLWPAGTAGQITGIVWEDDDDSVFELGESGLAGLEMRLETPGGTVLSSDVTAQDGSYGFVDLLPGTYRVRVVSEGWRGAPQGGDNALLGGDLATGEIALAADGAETANAGLVTVCEPFSLITYGSLWAYELDSDPVGDWTAVDFDDSAWSAAHGLLGFSNSAQVHASLGTSSRVTRYFRHAFAVAEPDLVAALELELERDDGAIVYLNGVEVMRSNMPSVSGPTTPADDAEWKTESAAIDETLLVAGTNVVAVELHQKWVHGDWGFDLELRATACEPCRVAAVEIEVEADTHLRSSASTTVHGGHSRLWMVGGGSPRAGALRLGLPALPPGSEVLGAEVIFEVTNSTTAYFPVYALATDWQENQASWEAASGQATWASGDFSSDDVEGEILAVAHVESLGDPYAMGLNAAGRAALEQWLSGAVHRGLALTPWVSTSSDSFALSSRESAAPPRLRVVYRDASCQE